MKNKMMKVQALEWLSSPDGEFTELQGVFFVKCWLPKVKLSMCLFKLTYLSSFIEIDIISSVKEKKYLRETDKWRGGTPKVTRGDDFIIAKV